MNKIRCSHCTKRIVIMFFALILVMCSVFFVKTVDMEAADDYPSQYKNCAKDSCIDEWNFYNRECTSFVAWSLNSRNNVAFNNYYKGVHWGNANNWGNAARRCGITVDMNPTVGSVWWSDKGANGHVAWVSSVDGNNVHIEEYNFATRGGYGERTLPINSATGYIHIKDISAKPSIDDVRIDSIDSSHITVSFTANNSALAKVNVTSVSTGETKEQSFTSGLSRITYTFNTSTMSNPGKDFFIRIYVYRTQSGGDEALHSVTYGSTIGQVHMPDKEIKYNIEALPSNLVTTGRIGGWVTGEKITKITSVVNNVEYECCRMDRPDVANAFPGYSGSGAGFYLDINALNIRHGSNDLTIRAYTSDYDYIQIYNGKFTATKLHETYFDWSWYYAKYCSIDSDVAAIGPDYGRLLEHFYTVGISKGYSPCIGLNIKWYLDKNIDVKNVVGGTYEGAYSHFVNFCMGANEFRETSEFLNLMYYKNINGDLQNMTSAGLFMHYYQHGSRLEGRLGNTTNEAKAFVKAYSPKEYAKWNKDVENSLGDGTTFESAGNLWHHFLVYTLAGNENNRRITDTFDLSYYMSRYGISDAATAFWRYINSGYANNEQATEEQ